MSRDVHSCTHWLRPHTPRIWTRYTRALLVSQATTSPCNPLGGSVSVNLFYDNSRINEIVIISSALAKVL
jgi:hypothetical protein